MFLYFIHYLDLNLIARLPYANCNGEFQRMNTFNFQDISYRSVNYHRIFGFRRTISSSQN